MKIQFNPKYRKVANLEQIFSIEDIKNEPMLFQADYTFALKKGGKICSYILKELLLDQKFYSDIITNPNYLVIDLRVNMLTKGVYPSIPGWHCDDVPRKNRYSQPDFKLASDSVTHYLTVISDQPKVSGTEFILSKLNLDLDKNNVWGSLHKKVSKLKNLKTRRLVSGELIEFNQLAIHRATPALRYGWRVFFRASFTYRKPTNEIRNQTQVYYDVNNAGW